MKTFTIWLYLLFAAGEWANALLIGSGILLLALSTWLLIRHQRIVATEEYLSGYQLGYERGARDTRATLTTDEYLTFPPRSLHEREAHYPLIVETLGDGTQRRLDR